MNANKEALVKTEIIASFQCSCTYNHAQPSEVYLCFIFPTFHNVATFCIMHNEFHIRSDIHDFFERKAKNTQCANKDAALWALPYHRIHNEDSPEFQDVHY